MDLPSWIIEAIKEFGAPYTGRIIIELELYRGGVTKLEIGGFIRHKPLRLEAESGGYGVVHDSKRG